MVMLKDGVLEFHPDTLEYVRKEVNLEKEGRIEEAIDILEDWVKKQEHFAKKDYPREYLERTLITAKGLVERAKLRIDKLCTFKTLMPTIYPKTVSKSDYDNLNNCIAHAHLPKLTNEHYRIYMLNMISDKFYASDLISFYRYTTVVCEYLKRYDYNCGFVLVLDFSAANILNFVAKTTPMELRQVITLITEGYGFRIKQIHLISASKMVDALVALFKQVFSAKLGGRIQLHKSIDSLYEYLPKDVLPVEYGGAERSLKTLNEEWIDAVTAPDFVEYFEDMYKANTNESYRRADKFTEQYIGLPGSFRALSVD